MTVASQGLTDGGPVDAGRVGGLVGVGEQEVLGMGDAADIARRRQLIVPLLNAVIKFTKNAS